MKIKIRSGYEFGKLQSVTPIGNIDCPEHEVKKIIDLADEELLQKALSEHKNFCLSPTTFALIERRFLGRELQQLINPNIGLRHT